MYKSLFILLFDLITRPEKAWVSLSEKQDKNNEEFYKSYLYPVFGLIAFFAFVGVFFHLKSFELQIALKTMLREILTYLLAFYCASLALSKISASYLKVTIEIPIAERFVGYSSALIYVVAMLYALFPSLFFLQIIIFYVIYVIWQGAVFYLKLDEQVWIKFTIIAGALIIILPFIINFLISLIMPGMK